MRDAEFCSELNHMASFSGFTPLHYAVVTGNRKMVETLFSYGADPLIANSRGLLPQAYASSEMAELLKQKESQVRYGFSSYMTLNMQCVRLLTVTVPCVSSVLVFL